MKRTLIFKFLISLGILIFSSDGQSCPCNFNDDILQCNVTNTSSIVNTNLCNSNEYNSINIIYSGNVVLNLITSSIKPIFINPVTQSNSNTLQISAINTNANYIEIQIYLSLNQVLLPLFTTPSSIIAPTSTLSINVLQNIIDAMDFKVFEYSTLTVMNFANYELIFNTTVTNSGTLYLHNLILGLTSLTSITISGNNHSLVVNKTQMPLSINVNQLSLKYLHLYDQILYNFTNLQEYSIEGCEYNQTAQFLNSNQNYKLSLEMINNNPLNSVLPNNANAFQGLGTLKNLTLIEPNLNSSCLQAISISAPATILLELGSYQKTDFDEWVANDKRPIVNSLTINNIKNLSIFSVKYFDSFDGLQNLVLQGSFELEKADLCIFTGITIQPPAEPTKVTLSSSKNPSSDWNECADTYIAAINQYSTNNVDCSQEGTYQDCQEWANATEQCDLISYENNCGGVIVNPNNPFTYNNSYLYLFFQRLLVNVTSSTRPPIPQGNSINIGAIIGALCGLLIAIIVLGLTIFCIYRNRQKDATKYMFSTPGEKYGPSSHDPTHLSIATSKTSQSSRYAMQNSFFPPLQPNDEIAPPLYTAPSVAGGSVSPYNLPSAPLAPRDSISTHATHVYETLDP